MSPTPFVFYASCVRTCFYGKSSPKLDVPIDRQWWNVPFTYKRRISACMVHPLLSMPDRQLDSESPPAFRPHHVRCMCLCCVIA